MNAETHVPSIPTCTAFLGTERIAMGDYAQVAQALAERDLSQGGGLLVFDDATGTLVDYPWPAGYTPEQPAHRPRSQKANPPCLKAWAVPSWAWWRGK